MTLPTFQKYLLTVTLFISAAFVSAEEIAEIQWVDLIPRSAPQTDPLANLSVDAIDHIEWIIYLRMFLPKEITPEYREFHEELAQALPELKEQGIDVDAIIADREERNTALNQDLDGKTIKLAGYLLPLDLSGNAITDFLLVPYVGACIHVPPPPPNQIVHAVTETPTPYELDSLFKPVSVTGTITVKQLSKELFLVDGSSDIDIGYSMTVNRIDTYTP